MNREFRNRRRDSERLWRIRALLPAALRIALRDRSDDPPKKTPDSRWRKGRGGPFHIGDVIGEVMDDPFGGAE